MVGDTLYFGGEQAGEQALMSLDLSQLPDEALGAETEAKDLEQTEVWPSVWGVSQLQAVADRLFFVERTPADIATLYVLDKGETKPKIVVEGYKLRQFVVEPDGKSGYLMAMTSDNSFILPFDVP